MLDIEERADPVGELEVTHSPPLPMVSFQNLRVVRMTPAMKRKKSGGIVHKMVGIATPSDPSELRG